MFNHVEHGAFILHFMATLFSLARLLSHQFVLLTFCSVKIFQQRSDSDRNVRTRHEIKGRRREEEELTVQGHLSRYDFFLRVTNFYFEDIYCQIVEKGRNLDSF